MTEDSLKYLDPTLNLTDKQVGEMMREAERHYPKDMEVVAFLNRNGQEGLAVRWLSEQKSIKLKRLAPVYQRMFEMKHEKARRDEFQFKHRSLVSINNGDHFDQQYGTDSRCNIINK